MKKSIFVVMFLSIMLSGLLLHPSPTIADEKELFGYLYPPILTEEEFENYYEKIEAIFHERDEDKAFRKLELRRFYAKYDFTKTDLRLYDGLLGLYPFIHPLYSGDIGEYPETLYFCKDYVLTAPSYIQEAYEEAFASAGYTKEMHEKILEKYGLPYRRESENEGEFCAIYPPVLTSEEFNDYSNKLREKYNSIGKPEYYEHLGLDYLYQMYDLKGMYEELLEDLHAGSEYDDEYFHINDIYPFLKEESLYVIAPRYRYGTNIDIELAFKAIGYTKEQHQAILNKYGLPYRSPDIPDLLDYNYGSESDPIIVDFSVPKIYEANDLEYEYTSTGDFYQVVVKNPDREDKFLRRARIEYLCNRVWNGDPDGDERLQQVFQPSILPGISYYYYSVDDAFVVHDPKKVFGYEWFWIGGREQTIYNGMNEEPEAFLSSLERGRLKITLTNDLVEKMASGDPDFGNGVGFDILLEEKTTGLFYKIPAYGIEKETTIYLDLPASEYFIILDTKSWGDDGGDYEVTYYDTIGNISRKYDVPFAGLLGEYGIASEYYCIVIDNPKVTIGKKDACSVSIGIREEKEGTEYKQYAGKLYNVRSKPIEDFISAANRNDELLVYDFIHADKILPDQSSLALYKLAKAYNKNLPEGYYKQYLTSFEYLHQDALLPVDVRLDIYDMLYSHGRTVIYSDFMGYNRDKSAYTLTGSVYSLPGEGKQMFLVSGEAATIAEPVYYYDMFISERGTEFHNWLTQTDSKPLLLAFPMDTATRICGEMISAYDHPEMFGYQNGEIDKTEYAFQVLRCCSDLYQYTAKQCEWDCGMQLRFRNHTEKDPSSVSGEKMVYDRTVCQYLPQSVIDLIDKAVTLGVITEVQHSTPANNSSLWWEPLKKEPLGEIHLTDEDRKTIVWPTYSAPVVVRKEVHDNQNDINGELSTISETDESSEGYSTKADKSGNEMEKSSSSNFNVILVICLASGIAVVLIIVIWVLFRRMKKRA